MWEAKAASKSGNKSFEKSMNSIFDDVLKEEERLRDKKLELDG